MISWLLVAVIIASTTIGDILQSSRNGSATAQSTTSARAASSRPISWVSETAVPAVGHLLHGRLILLVHAVVVGGGPELRRAGNRPAGYVVETILARVLLKEHIDYRRWVGALLVAAGVVFARRVIQLLYPYLVAAASYQILAFIACVRHILRRHPAALRLPARFRF